MPSSRPLSRRPRQRPTTKNAPPAAITSKVAGVATAVPTTRLHQSSLIHHAEELLGEDDALDTFVSILENARIEERRLAKPLEWYFTDQGHASRSRAYVEQGLPLIEEAAGKALARAGLTPEDVDALVFVSTTGIATPSLDARLVNRMPFRDDIARVPVWGLGCAGGVAGLNRAAELAQAAPGRRVLVVCLELCSLSFDAASLGAMEPDLLKKNLVAMGIFGDGCAAVVVENSDAGRVSGAHRANGNVPGSKRADQPDAGPWHRAGRSRLFRRTERVMGWDVTDRNLEVVLAPDIPAIVAKEMGSLVADFLHEHNAERPPDHWVLHPGGARVLDAYSEALDLGEEELASAVDVLRAYGNMSSPTVLFSLERVLDAGQLRPGETALLAALGPGFAAELALIQG